MKIKKIIRINVGGDWDCSLCGNERWSHYAFIFDNRKIQYICKDCTEKDSKLTDEIRFIEEQADKLRKKK